MVVDNMRNGDETIFFFALCMLLLEQLLQRRVVIAFFIFWPAGNIFNFSQFHFYFPQYFVTVSAWILGNRRKHKEDKVFCTSRKVFHSVEPSEFTTFPIS